MTAAEQANQALELFETLVPDLRMIKDALTEALVKNDGTIGDGLRNELTNWRAALCDVTVET